MFGTSLAVSALKYCFSDGLEEEEEDDDYDTDRVSYLALLLMIGIPRVTGPSEWVFLFGAPVRGVRFVSMYITMSLNHLCLLGVHFCMHTSILTKAGH